MSNTKNIPRLIIDTDFETDCDDAGALAVAHKLADENIIELAAVNASVNSPLPALGVAALNAAFGRRNLPVGCNTSSADTPEYDRHCEKTAALLYHYRLPELCYASENSIISSKELYLRLLNDAPDNSITVCAVGLLTSLAELIDDGYLDLMHRKIKAIYTMAKADYPSGRDCFNWMMNRRAAATVLNNFKNDIVVSSSGSDILTRAGNGISRRSLILKCAYTAMGRGDENYLRPSWDQITVLAASEMLSGYAELSEPGFINYDQNSGEHSFTPDENGNFRFLLQTSPNDKLTRYVQEWMDKACL
jgi:inosine-uridine nucleoside N-ribohydrolase